jgi:hypothetical protein
MLNPKNWLGFSYRENNPPDAPAGQHTFEITAEVPNMPPQVIGAVTLDSDDLAHLYIQSVCAQGQPFHRFQLPEPSLIQTAGMPTFQN